MNRITNYIKASRLLTSSFVVIAASMFVNVVNYLYHLIFGRLLGPVDYGVLASLYSILYIVSIVPQSTSFAIVKFISAAKNNREQSNIYNSINNLAVKLALVLSILLISVSYPVSKFMNIDDYKLVMLTVPVLFLSIITLVNQATSQGLMKYSGLIIPNILSSLGKFVIGLVFIFLGAKVFGAMIGVVFGVLFAYIYSYFEIKKYKLNASQNGFGISSFLKYAFPVLIQSLAYTSIFTADLILVKHFLSAHDAGIYASLSMLGKVIFFAVSPITSVLFPEISSRKSKGEPYKKVIVMSLGLAILACLCITFIYTVFPNLIVSALYGAQYLDAVGYLKLVAIYMSLYTLSYMLTSFFLSIDRVWVSYLGLILAIGQILAIGNWHDNLAQVLNVSIVLLGVNFAILLLYLVYNLNHDKKD